MLDISKKYWIRFFNLNIKCSIKNANVVCRDLNSTKISNEAKEFFKNSDNPTAYSDDFNSIKYLEELEKEGYVVFYDVDEPIGHDLTDDELFESLEELLDSYSDDEKDKETVSYFSLDSKRKTMIDSFKNQRRGFLSEEEISKLDYNYPLKVYGVDWNYANDIWNQLSEEEIKTLYNNGYRILFPCNYIYVYKFNSNGGSDNRISGVEEIKELLKTLKEEIV